MRIIGGEFRSRRLLAPRDDSVTRPIPDRVKESLFGLLRAHCEGAAVFDCFAGTGALGLEAPSRGAARCVFVERSREAADILRRNIETLGVTDRAEIVVGDALGAAALARAPRPLNLAFFDPPYPVVRDPLGWRRTRDALARAVALLAPDGFAILRTPAPFLIDQETPGAAPPLPARRPRERRGREDRSRRWESEADHPVRGHHAEDAPPPAAPTPHIPPGVPADLGIPGAAGPETHTYASTALHLYMRAPAQAGPAPMPT